MAAFSEVHRLGLCGQRFGRKPLVEQFAFGVAIPDQRSSRREFSFDGDSVFCLIDKKIKLQISVHCFLLSYHSKGYQDCRTGFPRFCEIAPAKYPIPAFFPK
jgi:hypothetical protein